mmetsp:Transcript_5893/g.24656  ORF Transcript_5893/g.24656 Transcript_5893/m.24656 type:complete len:326 (-) Transcript_5893:716-1693(-)
MLQSWLREAHRTHGRNKSTTGDLFRVKGVIAVRGTPRKYLLQGIRGRLAGRFFCDASSGDHLDGDDFVPLGGAEGEQHDAEELRTGSSTTTSSYACFGPHEPRTSCFVFLGRFAHVERDARHLVRGFLAWCAPDALLESHVDVLEDDDGDDDSAAVWGGGFCSSRHEHRSDGASSTGSSSRGSESPVGDDAPLAKRAVALSAGDEYSANSRPEQQPWAAVPREYTISARCRPGAALSWDTTSSSEVDDDDGSGPSSSSSSSASSEHSDDDDDDVSDGERRDGLGRSCRQSPWVAGSTSGGDAAPDVGLRRLHRSGAEANLVRFAT